MLASATTVSGQLQRLGDLDADGQPTVLDLVRLIQHINGTGPLSAALLPYGDVDESGAIDRADVDLIGDAILGLVPLPNPYEAPLVSTPIPATNGGNLVISGLARPHRVVTVSGGAGTATATADAQGRFTVTVVLQSNRVNNLFFMASNSVFTSGTPQPVKVIQDSEPPSLHLDFPTNDQVLTTSRTVIAGRVGDLLSGFRGLNVWVHSSPSEGPPPPPGPGAGGRANVDVGIGNNGTFERGSVPLAPGSNFISVTAIDALGNTVGRQMSLAYSPLTNAAPTLIALAGDQQVTNVHRRLGTPIAVRVLQADGVTPFANKVVEFDVTRSDGRLLPVDFGALAGPSAFSNDVTRTAHGVLRLQLRTDGQGEAHAWWALGGDAGCGNNRVCVMSADIANALYFCASAKPAAISQINVGTGNEQSGEAGAFVADPLRAWVSDSCNGIPGVPITYTVLQGDGRLAPAGGGPAGVSLTVTSSITGHAEALLQLGPAAGPNVVEANYPGNPNFAAAFVAHGRTRDPSRPTTFSGLVLDNTTQPIGGAWVRLYYNTPQGKVPLFSTFTDESGHFAFTNANPGPADLNVLGSFATTVGAAPVPGGTFPALSFNTVLVPNAENSLPRPVLLPRLNTNNAVRYTGTNDVVLTCEGMAGLKMTIKANSMRLPNGLPVTPATPALVSLNQVHHDDVPMPIPDGAAPPFAWTLQPGGSTFDPPITIEYPNMSALPAGTIAYFLSYNHDTERFEIVSSGHVTDDGARILTDPGAGLTLAGWGCNCPPYSVTSQCCKTPSDRCKRCENNRIVNQPDGTPADDGDPCTENDRCQAGKAKGDPAGGLPSCNDIPATFVLVTQESSDPAKGNFATLTKVGVAGQPCYDSKSRNYHFKTDTRGYDTDINLTLAFADGRPASIEPNPGPGGNVTEENYCAIIAELARYKGATGGGRGSWHTLEASRAHEEYHRDVDFRRLFDARWPQTEAQLKSIAVSCQTPFASDVAQGMANAYIRRLQVDVLRDVAAFTKTHNGQTDDGAYGAAQVVLNRMIERVRAFAAAEGWPECGTARAPKFGPAAAPSPQLIGLAAAPLFLTLSAGQSVAATLTGQFSDGSNSDLTAGATGSLYSSSEPAIATVTPDGRITAVSPGYALIVASHSPGTDLLPLLDVIEVTVTSPDDRDGDLMPDAWEIAHGFDPNNPADAGLDADGDGLDNLHEFLRATDPHHPDTDSDGLLDGAEVEGGEDPLRPPALNEQWQVMVNGQSVEVSPDGSFILPNISAPDVYGLGGPGSPPDFLSDDFVRLTGQGTILGATYYVYSEPFQFRGREMFELTNLTFTTEPPLLPVSIRATADRPLLTGLGQTTQVRVAATLGNGNTVDATPRTRWTTYRTSNPAIATVSPDGLVMARGRGPAFITAVNDGATSVCQIDVAPGDPLTTVFGYVQTTNGMPVATATVNLLGQAVPPVLTRADGSFVLTNVPTTLGPLRVAARLVSTTAVFANSGLLAPIPGGVTDAGILTLRAGVTWVGTVSSSWHGATNWSTGQVPGAASDVYLAAPAGVVISIAQSNVVVNSLLVDSTLRLAGVSLRAAGIIQANTPILMAGGTLSNCTVFGSSTSPALVATAADGRVRNSTIHGDIDLSAAASLLRIGGANTINGVVMLSGADARLVSEGDVVVQTTGGGEILFPRTNGAPSHLARDGGGSLTLGPGVMVHGGRGTIGDILLFGGAFGLTNYGTVVADVGGQDLTLDPGVTGVANFGVMRAGNGGGLSIFNLSEAAGLEIGGGGTLTVGGNWRNTGVVTVNNSTLTLAGAWTNAGALNLTNATLNLGGSFNLIGLGGINRAGGAVNLTGGLNLGGGVLTLSATTNWSLAGGSLSNGAINLIGAGALVPTAADGRLRDVTVSGNIDLAAAGARLRLSGVNRLDGILNVSGSDARLISEGHTNIRTTGGGEILFPRTNGALSHLARDGGGSLTFGPGLLIHGGRGTIGDVLLFGGAFSLTNYGTIQADANGQSLTFDPGINMFANFGTVRASNGGSLSVVNLPEAAGLEITGGGALAVGGTWRNTGALTVNNSTLTLSGNWTNAGTIRFTNSTLNLGGSFNLAGLGAIQRSGGAVNLTGSLHLEGGVLTLGPATGSWLLAGGTLSNGTVNLLETSALVPSTGDGRLSGVTLNGNLALSADNALLRLSGANTLNGVLTMGGSDARLISEGTVAVNTSGGGEIVFTRTSGGSGHLSRSGAGTLTLGPGLMIHGGRGILGEVFGFGGPFSLTNHGTLLADVSGQSLTLDPTINGFANFGTLGASNGSLAVAGVSHQAGTLRAGPDGVVTVNGALPLSAGGTLELHVSGTDTNRFGRVQVSGVASLAGTLRIVRAAGYVPIPNDRFRFMTFGSRSGVFAAVDGAILGSGLTFNVDLSDPLDLELFVTGP